MLVRVNAATFAAESSQLGAAARGLQSATSSAAGRLSGCSGMAGIDPMAEEFANGSKQEGGYDQSMQSMLDAGVTLSQAIAGFEGYLLGLAAGYRAVELAGAGQGANIYASMTPTSVAASCPYAGSSLGDEQRGTPQGEIMEWIENFLKDTAGIVIPTADTGKVTRAASAWDSFSAELLAAKATVASALPGTAAATFPQQGAVLAVQSKLEELINDLADDAKSLGEGCTSYASSVESIRGELLAMLGQLALEIAIDIGVGVALSFFTFGAGAAAGIAKAATTVARWIPKIIAVLNRLKTLIMSAKRTMAVMRRAAIESIKSTVSGTIANAGASLAFGNFSWDGLGGAALSSGIGGVVSGPFSHIGSNIASRGTRITTRASIDGVTGAGGGIAGEWAASQVTGQDFNLLMAALVGTAGGTAGGGLGAIKSPGGGGGLPAGGVPGNGAPSAGGGGAGSAGGSGASGGSGSNAGVPSGGAPTGGVPSGGTSGGAAGGGSSAGGSGADGHVDVPASLGDDGPGAGAPSGGTSGATGDGSVSVGDAGAGSGSTGGSDAPGSNADGNGWTPESDGNGWTPESDGNGWTPESDGNGWTPESDGNGWSSDADGSSSTPDAGGGSHAEVDGSNAHVDGDGAGATPDSSNGQGGADARPGVGATHPGGPGGRPDVDGPAGTPDADGPSNTSDVNDVDGSSSNHDEGVGGSAGDSGADSGARSDDSAPADTPPVDETSVAGDTSSQKHMPLDERPSPKEYPRPEFTSEVTISRVNAPGPRTPFAARTGLEPNTLYHVDGRGDFYTDVNGRVTYVETTYGGKGNLNADLQNPQGNTTYVVHPDTIDPVAGRSYAHVFETDGDGRTAHAHTDNLAAGNADRSESVQTRVGREGGPGYDGGHLFGRYFGGGGEYSNLVAMLRDVNRGSGDSFFNLENQWRELLSKNPNAKIEVDIKPIYTGSSTVPSSVQVSFRIDGGRIETRSFGNV